jgi:leucyl aminopeptidase
VPWAHLDVAGPAFNNNSPYGYVSSGGTGMAVRTLVTLAETLAG